MLFVFRLWFWKLDASMHEPFNGFRGPLTPSQLTELQHQALIYKYITSIVAVPSNLIIPLKKSLCPYGFTSSSAASFPPNSSAVYPAVLRFHSSFTLVLLIILRTPL
ncbi:hypothetical protein V6N11_038899 [Hibiscus sabdariffa]|uniref:Growth-regulating factor n=1 Tax=Hibiscus sabdariffa TaxID=183260 RepID=A0ABR2SLC4_9ROSI